MQSKLDCLTLHVNHQGPSLFPAWAGKPLDPSISRTTCNLMSLPTLSRLHRLLDDTWLIRDFEQRGNCSGGNLTVCKSYGGRATRQALILPLSGVITSQAPPKKTTCIPVFAMRGTSYICTPAILIFFRRVRRCCSENETMQGGPHKPAPEDSRGSPE